MSKSFRRYITAKKRASQRRFRQHHIEQLEQRINPSSVTFAAGVLTVTGDATGDTISVEDLGSNGFLDITINGVLNGLHPAVASTNRINVSALDGADNVAITGLSIQSSLDGGLGTDSLVGGNGGDTLIGGAGNDTLVGGTGADSFSGGFGNDSVLGDFNDVAFDGGTDGNGADVDSISLIDTLAGDDATSRALSFSNFEAATVDAADGNDTVSVNVTTSPEAVLSFLGGTGNDTLRILGGPVAMDGGQGNDSLIGGDFADTLLGDDTASAGNDTLDSGAGADSLDGGAGNNSILGGSQSDTIVADDGNNVIFGDSSSDTAPLGGNDSIVVGNGINEIHGGSQDDTITVGDSLSGGNNTVLGDAGADILAVFGDSNLVEGGSGNDSVVVNGDTNDVFGDDGDDTLVVGDGPASGTALLAQGDINYVAGGEGNDSISVPGVFNTIEGGAGNDTMSGGTGNDDFAGNDFLFDADSDLGSDEVSGTAPRDSLDYSLTTGFAVTVDLGMEGVQVVDANHSVALPGLKIEAVIGTPLDDSLLGSNERNWLEGIAGNDTLAGRGGGDNYTFDADADLGSDLIIESPGEGSDLVDFINTSANVTVDLGSTDAQIVNANLTLTLQETNTDNHTEIEVARGGFGNDFFTGSSVNNTLFGGPGDDTLLGLAGNDFLQGDDPVGAAGGSDSMAGGLGDDTYFWDSRSLAGDDTVNEQAAEGTDSLDFTDYATDLTIDLSQSATQTISSAGLTLTLNGSGVTPNVENVHGGTGEDSLTGSSDDNVIIGGAGADTQLGLDGNDTLGELDDEIDTTLVPGIEILVKIKNSLSGGNGNDLLIGEDGDTISGGAGIDGAQVSGSKFDDFDTSSILIGPNAGDTTRISTLELVTVFGLEGSDRITIHPTAGLAAASIEGGDGDDTLDERGSGIAVTLAGGKGFDFLAGDDSQDSLAGGDDDDTMLGDPGNDVLDGGAGSDSLAGDAGSDFLVGGTDDDSLFGGSDDDFLDGEAGDDSLVGGTGSDIFIFTGDSLGNDTVSEAANLDADELDFSSFASAITLNLALSPQQTVSQDNLTLTLVNNTGIETVVGSSFNDHIVDNSRANLIDAGSGNDTVIATTGNDTLIGDLGNDSLSDSGNTNSLIGAEGDDTLCAQGTLLGGDGDDSIHGGKQPDSIDAGAGDDTVEGGGGNDSIVGGEGADLLNGGPSDIDTSGLAWGLYANSGQTAVGYRDLSNSLLPGNTFEIDLDTGFIASGGSVGFVLRNGSDTTDRNAGRRFELFFQGGGSGFTIRDATGPVATGIALTELGVHVSLALTSVDTFDLTVESAGCQTFEYSGTFAGSGTIDSLALYNANAGSNADHTAYFNSVRVSTTNVVLASDRASADAYADGWDNGDNGGSGFGAWTLTTTNGNSALNGFVIASSTGNGTGPTSNNDTLLGGAGDDTLIGGAGNDVLDGGDNTDFVDFSDSSAAVTVDLEAGTASGNGNDTLTDVEGVVGSIFDDSIVGATADDTFTWNTGDGNDTFDGRAGNDLLIVNGTDGDDSVTASAAGNLVNIDDGADTVIADNIENLALKVGNGADTVTVNDLFGTDVVDVDVGVAGAGAGFGSGSGSGAVIVDGGDRDDFAHGDVDPGPDSIVGTADDVNLDGWKFIEQMVNFGLTGANNGGAGVLAIGASTRALEAITSVTNVLGVALTTVTDAEIATVDFTQYAVVYVPSDEFDTSGGVSDSDLELLSARRTDVLNFVNNGGSLVALTEDFASEPFGWLELPELFTIAHSGGFNDLYQTPALAAAGFSITDEELSNGTPWHNSFTGPPGFNGLVPFVMSLGLDGNQGTDDDEIVTLGLAPGTAGRADGSADLIVVHGRSTADDLTASPDGSAVHIAGLTYSVDVSGSSPADPDTLSIHGDDANDTLTAESGLETIIRVSLAGNGNDDSLSLSARGSLDGGDGEDTLIGSSGDDSLDGGNGNDTLVGGGGDDTLEGGAGDDQLDGGSGDDTVTGGDGTDTLVISGTSGLDDILVAPTGAGSGTATVPGFSTALYSEIELVVVDGNGGDDALRVVLPSTDDTVTYTPGSVADEGSIQVNAFAPIDFEDLGAGGTVVFADSGGIDSVHYNGTDNVDDFTIDQRSALIDLLGHIRVGLNSVESFTFDALASDDNISIVNFGQAPGGAGGDVFLAVGGGMVERRHPDGTLVATLTSGVVNNVYDAGMSFDSFGNLYVTMFGSDAVSVFSPGGVFTGTFGSGFNTDPESIVFDLEGNAYVGQADGSGDILKFNAAGDLVASYDVAIEDRGSDWVDLAADQTTIFYTSEGEFIHRFDVSTNTQLADFTPDELPGSVAFALRIDPATGDVFVADSELIARVNTDGDVVQTYDAPGQDGWFALNLDPDGTSFWSANIFTGDVYRFDIATGAVLTHFAADLQTALGGIAIQGEITAGGPRSGGLNEINIIGGPAVSDNVTLVGSAGADKLNVTIDHGLTGDTITGGGVDIHLTEIENLAIDGSNGSDTLTFTSNGTSQLNTLTITGGSGPDSITGSTESEFIDGGTQDDTLDGGAGNDTISGNSGNDSLNDISGTDSLLGGDGNDTLCALDGSSGDTLDGGAGDDTFCGEGNDSFEGGAGEDSVIFNGTGGDDTIDVTDANVDHITVNGSGGNDSLSVNPDSTAIVDGGAGNDTISAHGTLVGGLGNDLLLGSDLADSIEGGAGSDSIEGNGGNDTIDGGDGSDSIQGGDGNDNIVGGFNSDTILGDAGDDTIIAGRGDTVPGSFTTDSVDGGEGNDSISGGEFGGGTLRGNLGDDTIQANFTQPTYIVGGAGADSLLGGNANDTIIGGDDTVVTGTDSMDTITGGGGNDSITGNAGADTIDGGSGNDNIDAGEDDDTVQGGLGLDTIHGGNGSDTIDGGGDADSLSGDAGNDSILGGDGNDTMEGGTGLDTMNGGAGNNLVIDPDGAFITLGSGNDTFQGTDAEDFVDGGAGDDLIIGNGGNDFLIGNTGNDTLQGSEGDDTLEGGSGQDSLIGGAGNDFVSSANDDSNDTIQGNEGDDSLDGGVGNDSIDGGLGVDSILGGDGNDTVLGRGGNDSVQGGKGDDRFDGGDGQDTIMGDDGNDSILGGNGIDESGSSWGLYASGGNTAVAYRAASLAISQAFSADIDAGLIDGGGSVGLILRNGTNTTDRNTGARFEIFLLGGSSNYMLRDSSGVVDTGIAYTDAGVHVVLTQTGTDTYAVTLSTLADNATFQHSGTLAGSGAINSLALYNVNAGSDSSHQAFFNHLAVNAGAVASDHAANAPYANGWQTGDNGGSGFGTWTLSTTSASANDNGFVIGSAEANGDVTNQSDSLVGGVGDDTISGGAGNDSVDGSEGNDSLRGDLADDSITGGVGNDTINGDAGVDSLVGGDGTDLIDGGADGDSVSGNAGIDTLLGSAGNDTIAGGTEADSINGGADNDSLLGEDGNDTIDGSDGNDIILGGIGTNSLIGNAGNDSLVGDSGNDTLSGGSDNDTLSGAAGNDSIDGGSGNDSLLGGDNNDVLAGGSGNDTASGDLGNDTLTSTDGTDSLLGGDGNDSIVGGTGISTLDGGTGNDTVSGGTGGESLLGGTGNDSLSGNDGNDTVSGDAGVDSLSGGAGNDSLLGGTENDSLVGDSGSDVLDGGAGNDTMKGDAADDTANGLTGADTFSDTLGNNLFIQAGTMAAQVTAGSGIDTILTGSGSDSIDAGAGNDSIVSAAGEDTIDGNDGNDLIDAGSDNDSINGGAGDDFVLGGFGDDSILGDAGNDIIDGGFDEDHINGGEGNDSLGGGAGKDILFGDLGNDTLAGGADKDLLADFDGVNFLAAISIGDKKKDKAYTIEKKKVLKKLRKDPEVFRI